MSWIPRLSTWLDHLATSLVTWLVTGHFFLRRLLHYGHHWRHQGFVTDWCHCPMTRPITTGDLELLQGIESTGAYYTQSPLFCHCGWFCEFSFSDASVVEVRDIRQIWRNAATCSFDEEKEKTEEENIIAERNKRIILYPFCWTLCWQK